MGIHYDKEIINQIRKMDMTEFLSRYNGFSFRKQGVDYRCIEHNSLVIKGDKIRWFWNSKGIGGSGVIDYLTKIENHSFPEAIGKFHSTVGTANTMKPIIETPKKELLFLPERGKFPYLKLIQYLCTKRGIDSNIVFDLMDKNKIYQDIKGNVVFVGHDENNVPRFASVRGTGDKLFRMDCNGSDKRYSFSINSTEPDRLHIFESPVDALSFATLENIKNKNDSAWKKISYISLGGTSTVALNSFLQNNKQVNEIILCLDNDEAGKLASQNITKKYLELGYKISNIMPIKKDFNDDLLDYQKLHRKKQKYSDRAL